MTAFAKHRADFTMSLHRVVVNTASPGARALIELRLGVKTWTTPTGFGSWAIFFRAPEDVDLDFLRPDVLPPLSGETP